MERQRATKILRSLLDSNNLAHWKIRLVTDLTRPFLGKCSYRDKCIYLSAYHLDTHPDVEIFNTIKHEIAHALTEGHQHDDVWQSKAKELGCDNTLPCANYSLNSIAIDAIRSGNILEVDFEEQIIRTPTYKVTRLQDKCPFCGKVAKEKFSFVSNNIKYITLECYHIITKTVETYSPFQSVTSSDGKKLYDFQIIGAQFLEKSNGRAAIFDEMGLGKFLPVDTIIYTPFGPKQIGTIKIGDEVIGSDGNSTKIIGVYPQGERDLYKIEFTDNSSVEAGLEHLWQVNTPLRKWQGLNPQIKTTEELKNDLFTTSTNSSGKKNYKWFIPIVEPVKFIERQTTIHPYVLGLLLGDGTITTNNIRFTTSDTELIETINSLGYNFKSSSIKEYSISIKEKLHVKLKNYNLIGCRALTKFIPEDYLFNSVPNRLELLRGLMDTDGSIWNNGIVEYTTISPQLADDITFLVQSLGGIVRRTIKEEPKYEYKGEILIGQRCYRLVINIPICPFNLTRKIDLWMKYSPIITPKKYEPSRAIKSITFSRKAESICIAVDAEDKLYVVKDFIVTHNTVQALAWLKFHPEAFPVLFAVKSGIKFQWLKEILRWLGNDYFSQIISTSKDYVIPGLKTYIVSYDLLRRFDLEQIKKLQVKTLILDEVQQIKNPDATRTQLIRKIAREIPHIIPLSGTPWKNRGSEFFTVLNILDPTKFWSYNGFINQWVDRYWDGGREKMGGIRNPKKFKEYTSEILIRRERTEVMKELPLISRNILSAQMESDDQKTYDKEVSEFVQYWNEAVIGGEEDSFQTTQGILARLVRMRHITGLAKIPMTVDFVKDFIEETERKIVIFVHHKDVGNIIAQQLIDYCNSENIDEPLRLTADMNSSNRFQTQEEFNNNPNKRILVASTLASGEGLNLQKCSDCIMHERQWNPANEIQAEGRFIRIGQKAEKVVATYIHANGSIDDKLHEIVERKREAFDNAMNKDGSKPAWNENTLIKELAQSIVNSAKK